MDMLEPFIDSPDGMSLQADTKKFWSRMGPDDVEAAKDVRDPFTRFMVSKTSDKLLLKADTGKYVTLWGSERYLKCAKTNADNWCEFTVYDAGDGLIALRGKEDLFLSRWGPTQLRAAKSGVDNFCKFKPGYGNLFDPKFEIIDVKVDELPGDFSYSPFAADQGEYTNGGSLPQEHDYTLKYTNKDTQTTTWNVSWGFGITAGYMVGVPGVNETNFSVSISYNGEVGGSSSVENETSFERTITVKAAPKKKTIATLIIMRCSDAKIGFTATIKRRNADGTTQLLEEKGTWTGVAYNAAEIYVREEKHE